MDRYSLDPLILTWSDFALAADKLASMTRPLGRVRPFVGVYGVTGATVRAALAPGLDLLPCVWVLKGSGRQFAGPVLLGLPSIFENRRVVFPWGNPGWPAEGTRGGRRASSPA